jgi:hypothetical protein
MTHPAERLSDINFEKVYSTILDIADILQIRPTSPLRLPYTFSHCIKSTLNLNARQNRIDSLDYLMNRGVLTYPSPNNARGDVNGYVLPLSRANTDGGYYIHLDVDTFFDFKKHMDSVYKNRFAQIEQKKSPTLDQPPIPVGIATYRITFTMANEIVLNDVLILARPNLNNENAALFEYLMGNPNKNLQKRDIETALNLKIGKSFHKIIENLGFKGDLRKAFFKTAETSILFRNPVTDEQLRQLGIPCLRYKLPASSRRADTVAS